MMEGETLRNETRFRNALQNMLGVVTSSAEFLIIRSKPGFCQVQAVDLVLMDERLNWWDLNINTGYD